MKDQKERIKEKERGGEMGKYTNTKRKEGEGRGDISCTIHNEAFDGRRGRFVKLYSVTKEKGEMMRKEESTFSRNRGNAFKI